MASAGAVPYLYSRLGGGRYACEYVGCDKTFHCHRTLVRHQVAKHGRQRARPLCNRRSWKRSDKRYVCPGCRRGYYELTTLRRHQKLKRCVASQARHLADGPGTDWATGGAAGEIVWTPEAPTGGPAGGDCLDSIWRR